jgi:iron complex transport system permease protein
VCALSLLAGAVWVDPRDLPGSDILTVRVSRILLAIVAGAGLSVAGVIFQALLRNPLADPYVLGVSSGAGLGAACAILFGLTLLGAWTLPALAFVGSLGTIVLVYALARGAGGVVPMHTLLLSGVIVGAVFGSLLMFLVSTASSDELHDVVWWLLGNLQVFDWALVEAVAAVVVFGVLVAILRARDLNLMTLGEEPAAHLGLNVERTKRLFVLLASLVTGATVAACGLVGFVGLIVPHAVRLVVGPDHRRLVPVSVLAGAAFLVVADALARTVLAPVEIPIGVVTALVGGPFFLFLLRRRRRLEWG